MKIVLPLIILIFSLQIFAQEPLPLCQITKASLPPISKLKLGMTAPQISKIYPQTNFANAKYLSLLPAINSPTPAINSIDLSIINGKLMLFSVYYKPGIPWTSSKELAMQTAKALALKIPPDSWETEKTGGDSGTYTSADCRDFKISTVLNKSGNYRVSITDSRWLDETFKEDDKKKAGFKP